MLDCTDCKHDDFCKGDPRDPPPDYPVSAFACADWSAGDVSAQLQYNMAMKNREEKLKQQEVCS